MAEDSESPAIAFGPARHRRSRWRLAPVARGLPIEWYAGWAFVLVVAAALRLPCLTARGGWGADQGRDMLVLRGLVDHGWLPLLGPPASIDGLYHGPLYYVILAPAAFLSSSDPTAVAAEIAVLGLVAVALIGLAATTIAGRLTGILAALLAAVSPALVAMSTSIWNPNLVPAASALALAAAWRAWVRSDGRWWAISLVAIAVTVQLHLAALSVLPTWLILLAADVHRRDAAGRHALRLPVLAGLLVTAALFTPAVVGLARVGLSLDIGGVVQSGHATPSGGLDPVSTVALVLIRSLAWPVVGSIVDAPAAALAASFGITLVLVWGLRHPTEPARSFLRWSAATLVISSVLLAIGAPGLAGAAVLPTDHYHAAGDPVVLIVVAIGIAAVAGAAPAGARAALDRVHSSVRPGRVLAAGIVIALGGWSLAHQPARVAADGGWPGAQRTASRITAAASAGTIRVIGQPSFVSVDDIVFPLIARGASVSWTDDARPPTVPADSSEAAPSGAPTALVVSCDGRFIDDCGGPAEARLLATSALDLQLAGRLIDRFSPSPGRVLSVYRP